MHMSDTVKKNILLVDDDEIFNFLNRRTLEGLGMTNDIHTALNGQEALKLFNEYSMGSKALPDIVLLDLNMPIMDGFQFIEMLGKLDIPRKEAVKIIIVTSSQDPKDVLRAQKLGIEYFLTKPITEDDIRGALK
jgi:CheY-like chemotaxis protein